MPVSPVSIPSPGLISGEEASSPNHFAILAGPAVPLCLFFTVCLFLAWALGYMDEGVFMVFPILSIQPSVLENH